jgi:hypothetical protein
LTEVAVLSADAPPQRGQHINSNSIAHKGQPRKALGPIDAAAIG